MDISFGNKKLRLNVFNAFQGSQTDSCFEMDILKDIMEEATPIILSQNLLQTYLAHFRMDDFDVNRYVDKVNALLDTPYSKNIPS